MSGAAAGLSMGNALDPVKLVIFSCKSMLRLALYWPTQSTEPPSYVIRMPGGVGGGGREAPPYPD